MQTFSGLVIRYVSWDVQNRNSGSNKADENSNRTNLGKSLQPGVLELVDDESEFILCNWTTNASFDNQILNTSTINVINPTFLENLYIHIQIYENFHQCNGCLGKWHQLGNLVPTWERWLMFSRTVLSLVIKPLVNDVINQEYLTLYKKKKMLFLTKYWSQLLEKVIQNRAG